MAMMVMTMMMVMVMVMAMTMAMTLHPCRPQPHRPQSNTNNWRRCLPETKM
jgi:hypothetical protein